MRIRRDSPNEPHCLEKMCHTTARPTTTQGAFDRSGDWLIVL